MEFDSMTLARARLALREAALSHLSDPNVGLIDFGLRVRDKQIVEDEAAIRFHVYRRYERLALEAAIESGETHSDLSQPISVGGFRFETNVIEATYQPHQLWWSRRGRRSQPRPADPRTSRQETLRGGISISDEFHHTYGTLGALVVDRASGDRMILSNWHVLVADWRARAGQGIFQPGTLDGGGGADVVARLTRDAMSANLDAAVATLTGDRQLINDQLDLGPVAGLAEARPGMEVVKSGRRTGVTYGRVTGVEGIARINYGPLDRIIRHVVTIDPRVGDEEVSGPGDSGSLWLEASTMQAVGLHFAGSNNPERGLALDIEAVLNSLNVALVISDHQPQRSKPESKPGCQCQART
jgi:endonuclease G